MIKFRQLLLRYLPVLVALFALFLAAIVIWVTEQSRLAEKRAELSDQVADHAHAIERGIEHSLSSTYALAALIRHGKGRVDDFPSLAGEMLRYYDGAGALALAPAGVVLDIFPRRGNEKAIGHNLLRDPKRDKEAILARDTGRLTLAGPFPLVQGGIGAAGRLPVYLSGQRGTSFWGFAAVLLRFPQTIAPGNLEQLRQRGFDYRLWRLHPDTKEQQVIAASVSSPLPSQSIDHPIRVPNGEWQLSVAPRAGWIDLPLLAGKILLGLAFSLLLTWLAIAQRKLRRNSEELEHRVMARTRELAAARDAAETANRAKTAFLANMSHELRTPLNAITGMTELALRQCREDRQRQMLEKSRQASQQLLHLIDDVLDLARIEAERIAIEQLPFSPCEVAASCCALYEIMAEEKGLALEFSPPASLAQRAFLGDPVRLQQVLGNLIVNAIKFTPTGKVSLRLEDAGKCDGLCGISFAVADTGIGIAAEDLQRIFLPFEQADNSSTRRYGGSGLGLAICQRLIEHMGGKIQCESQLGQGSTFRFTLHFPPCATPLPQPEDPFLHSEDVLRRDHAGKRILLAEDDALNQEVIRCWLERAGLVVDLASSGAQAVDMAIASPYAAILLDLQMPVLDGIEAARIIRALVQHAGTPLIALTANAFAEARENALAAGMNDLLVKPLQPEQLFATLLRNLSRPAFPGADAGAGPATRHTAAATGPSRAGAE